MTASYPIIINSSNYVGNSSYVFNFGTSVQMDNINIALGSASLFYSWRNITNVKNNNKLEIIHPASGVTNDTISLTIPDGGYEVAAINDFIRYSMIEQGYYIQNDSTGEYTIYMEIRVNPATYSIEYVSYPVPTSLPTGFTAGSNISFPSTTRGPQLVVTSPGFGNLIGFETGTFPATQQSTITTTSSTKTPVLSDIQNVLITLDSATNDFSPNSKVIHAISYANVQYGRLITSEPNQLSYIPQQSGFRQSITIQLCDQLLRPLQLIDTDVTIKLLLQKQ